MLKKIKTVKINEEISGYINLGVLETLFEGISENIPGKIPGGINKEFR